MRLGISMRNVDDCIRGYHVDVDEDDVGVVSFTNNLNEMRRLTHSQVISIRAAEVDGVRVRLICPGSKEENGRKVSALDTSNKVVMHGSMVVTGRGGEGDDMISSLTVEDLSHIKDCIAMVDIGNEDDRYNTYVLCGVALDDRS